MPTRSDPTAQAPDDALFARVDALQYAWDLDGADALLEAEAATVHDRARLHHQRSALHMQRGRIDEAFEHARLADSLAPMHRAVRHHALTLEKLHPAQSPDRFLGRHRVFGADFAGEEAVLHRARPPRSGRGPLHVGYVTPDAHLAMARFVDCLRGGHDPARVRASFYYAFDFDAAAMARAFPAARHVALQGMSSAAVAQRLAADGLDVAVDLAGHGAGNQLLALQRRPAAVQCTWLDYVATTGVPAIDFRIADAITDPPGSERWSSETPLRLPVAAWCYQPHPDAPPTTPRAPREGLLLGSCCVPLKLTDATLALWRALLLALPDARLHALGVPPGSARERVWRALAGIDPARVRIDGRLSLRDFYAAIDGFDLALDPLPFSGATTTLDCLWQGVPVVTLPGLLPHARSSASILGHLGLDHWVARDVADFVAIVARLAADRAGREAFRRDARGLLRGDALFDAARFMPRLEDALEAAATETHARATAGAAVVVDDNRTAEAVADAGLAAAAAGDAPAAETLLRAALRQLPTLAEARGAYWRLVQQRAARLGPAPAAGMPRVPTVRFGAPHEPARLPPWCDPVAALPRQADAASWRDALSTARDAARGGWLLLADAGCVDWWVLEPAALSALLADADVLGPIGTRDPGGATLAGLRLIRQAEGWFGRAWPGEAPAPAASGLFGNWLLLRASVVDPSALAGGLSGTADASAALSLLSQRLAASGARLRVAPWLVGVDDGDPLRDAGWTQALHARLGALPGQPRTRIDVGRMFGVRDPAVAALLARALFAPC